MPIVIPCSSCETKLKAPESAAGRKVKCPRCGTTIKVPEKVTAAVQPAGRQHRSENTIDQRASEREAARTRRREPDNEPSRQTEADWGDSELLQRRRFVVRRNPLKLMRARFDILDPESKATIGMAVDQASTWICLLRSLSIGPLRLKKLLPTRIDFREEEDGPVLFSLRWRVSLVRFWVKVEIYDAAGELRAYFRNKLFSLFGSFHIYNAEDERSAM